MGDVYPLLCLRSELSKAFGLTDLCYSKISVVMLLWYREKRYCDVYRRSLIIPLLLKSLLDLCIEVSRCHEIAKI